MSPEYLEKGNSDEVKFPIRRFKRQGPGSELQEDNSQYGSDSPWSTFVQHSNFVNKDEIMAEFETMPHTGLKYMMYNLCNEEEWDLDKHKHDVTLLEPTHNGMHTNTERRGLFALDRGQVQSSNVERTFPFFFRFPPFPFPQNFQHINALWCPGRNFATWLRERI